jgi:HD-like signal output (HDOD) protein
LALVYIDDLAAGMILAEDLFTPKGRFVLAAGAALESVHLQKFKSWGILEIEIAEESLGEEYLRQQESIEEFTEKAEAYLYRRFGLNDIEQEPLATIYRHAVHRFALSLQKGWDPVIFAADITPPAEDDQQPLSVAQLLKGEVELVSLPAIYSHIVAALNDPQTSSHLLADVISKDASLSVRLLKLVNSPFYGFSGMIDSISRAVSLLGTNELTGLALGITLIRHFKDIPADLINMNSFWRHSIRCGLYAKILAGHLGEKGEETYFTGGLLHDIGRLIMLERMPGPYRRAIIKARNEKLPMYRAEQECLNSDHSIIGKLIAMRWRLPPPLIRMIGGHHSPNTNHYALETCLLHVADVLAHACGHEVNLVNEIPPLQLKAWEATGLKEDMIAPTIRQADAEFKSILNVFFDNSDD